MGEWLVFVLLMVPLAGLDISGQRLTFGRLEVRNRNRGCLDRCDSSLLTKFPPPITLAYCTVCCASDLSMFPRSLPRRQGPAARNLPP